eukprot:SM000327S12491  [mRNA]  locus=s327:45877:46311:- [translate_table: standard]
MWMGGRVAQRKLAGVAEEAARVSPPSVSEAAWEEPSTEVVAPDTIALGRKQVTQPRVTAAQPMTATPAGKAGSKGGGGLFSCCFRPQAQG